MTRARILPLFWRSTWLRPCPLPINGVDNTGADYPIPANQGIIRLCASGMSSDGNLQTLCVNAVADNAFVISPNYHILRGRNSVSDGCYQPNEVVQCPTITASYPSCGITGGSPTVTVTRSGGATINTVLTLGVLLLAIMVGVALRLQKVNNLNIALSCRVTKSKSQLLVLGALVPGGALSFLPVGIPMYRPPVAANHRKMRFRLLGDNVRAM